METPSMLRRSNRLVIAVLASVLVAPSTGRVQTASTTTSTSTSTTTSTTLAPHRFSPATQACIHAATRDYRECTGATADCLKAYQTAYAQCFAGSAGQKC